MRLQPKRVIAVEVAMQRKEQIDAGVSLARKVDTLRETVASEEANLQKFRNESVAAITAEIDTLLEQKGELENGNKELRDERIRLEAPVDLTQAWNEVKRGKQENSDKEDELNAFALRTAQKLADSQELAKDAQALKRELEKKQGTIAQALLDSEQDRKDAASALLTAKNKAEKSIKDCDIKERVLAQREESVAIREVEAKLRNDNNLKKEIELAKKEIALRDQYATLQRTLKRLNQK